MKLVVHKEVESILERKVRPCELKFIESKDGKGKVVQDTKQMTVETYSERRPDINVHDCVNETIYIIEIAVAQNSKSYTP